MTYPSNSFSQSDVTDVDPGFRNLSLLDLSLQEVLQLDSSEELIDLGPIIKFTGLGDLVNSILKLGYEIRKLTDPLISIAEKLNELNKTMRGIKAALLLINNGLQELSNAIKYLAEIILGRLDLNRLRSSLQHIDSSILIIEGYTQSEKHLLTKVGLTVIERQLGKMVHEIGQLREFTKGGASFILLATPAISVWAQFFTICEQAKEKIGKEPEHPNYDDYRGYKARKVYDQPFHKRYIKILRGLFNVSVDIGKQMEPRRQVWPYLQEGYDYHVLYHPRTGLPIGEPFRKKYKDFARDFAHETRTRHAWTYRVRWVRNNKGYRINLKLDQAIWARFPGEETRPWRLISVVEAKGNNKALKDFNKNHRVFMETIEQHVTLYKEVLEYRDEIFRRLEGKTISSLISRNSIHARDSDIVAEDEILQDKHYLKSVETPQARL
tara:strand:- start:3015 stop:4328 length:1314 start_codon:yes stop_codon:yes gene_type:complete